VTSATTSALARQSSATADQRLFIAPAPIGERRERSSTAGSPFHHGEKIATEQAHPALNFRPPKRSEHRTRNKVRGPRAASRVRELIRRAPSTYGRRARRRRRRPRHYRRGCRLIPARGAAFPFVGTVCAISPPSGKTTSVVRDLRQENHDRQNRSGALLEWKQAQNEDRAGTGR